MDSLTIRTVLFSLEIFTETIRKGYKLELGLSPQAWACMPNIPNHAFSIFNLTGAIWLGILPPGTVSSASGWAPMSAHPDTPPSVHSLSLTYILTITGSSTTSGRKKQHAKNSWFYAEQFWTTAILSHGFSGLWKSVGSYFLSCRIFWVTEM